MEHRRIADLTVHPVGLGCMPLSGGAILDERPRALATVHAALDAGMNLLDTADIYAPDGARFGHNEELVAEALRTWGGSPADRERVVCLNVGEFIQQRGRHFGPAPFDVTAGGPDVPDRELDFDGKVVHQITPATQRMPL